MIDKRRTACFTGHRNTPTNKIHQIEKELDRIIEMLYHREVIFYGSGGAYGFDMIAEKAVIRARKIHKDIKLILVLPCKNQDKYWTSENKKEFADILLQADKIVYTSDFYRKGCMYRRNRHLVDYSGYCICYLKKNSGGTAYTVDYARKNGLKIINIDENKI